MGRIKGWKKGRDDNKFTIWSNTNNGAVVVLIKKNNTLDTIRYNPTGVAIKKKYAFESRSIAKREAIIFMRGNTNG